MDVVIAILWVMFVLYILYGTNSVYSYLEMLPFLDRWTQIKRYKQFYQFSLPYSAFMLTDSRSFLVRLVSCRYCLGVWLSLVPSAIVGWDWLPLIYFGSQLGCSCFMWVESKFSNYYMDSEF
jgi:hypothetical protein